MFDDVDTVDDLICVKQNHLDNANKELEQRPIPDDFSRHHRLAKQINGSQSCAWSASDVILLGTNWNPSQHLQFQNVASSDVIPTSRQKIGYG